MARISDKDSVTAVRYKASHLMLVDQFFLKKGIRAHSRASLISLALEEFASLYLVEYPDDPIPRTEQASEYLEIRFMSGGNPNPGGRNLLSRAYNVQRERQEEGASVPQAMGGYAQQTPEEAAWLREQTKKAVGALRAQGSLAETATATNESCPLCLKIGIEIKLNWINHYLVCPNNQKDHRWQTSAPCPVAKQEEPSREELKWVGDVGVYVPTDSEFAERERKQMEELDQAFGLCPVCNEPLSSCPSGLVCPNGHGQ